MGQQHHPEQHRPEDEREDSSTAQKDDGRPPLHFASPSPLLLWCGVVSLLPSLERGEEGREGEVVLMPCSFDALRVNMVQVVLSLSSRLSCYIVGGCADSP